MCEMRRGEAAGTTRCCLSTSSRGRGALLLSNNPKGWDATRSSRAKRHLECALQRGLGLCLRAVCPEGDPLKGNLVQSHWWPLTLCVFVCLSKPILLTALSTVMWCGEGSPPANFQCKQNFKSLIFKKAQNALREYAKFPTKVCAVLQIIDVAVWLKIISRFLVKQKHPLCMFILCCENTEGSKIKIRSYSSTF